MLLSFNGDFAKLIYKGIKKYEIRKSNMKLITPNESLAFIYEVKPIGRVTGYFQIEELTSLYPKELLEIFDLDTNTKEYVKKIDDSKKLCVITIGKYKKFEKFIEIKNPPQSWRYLNNEEEKILNTYSQIFINTEESTLDEWLK